ncbi:MAG TPA: tyrosine-type recombinase/integrase [Acidimicrobiales bacterium]|jgi:integrase|nr:tyrosine-type recombinase/integrase [Acidimicrobiales bacterium]
MRSFDRQGDAQVFLNSTEVEIRQGQWVDPNAGKIPYSDWHTEWWATTVNLRPSTRSRDDGYFHRYVIPTFGSRHIGSINQMDVRGWAAGLVARDLAPATVTKAYQLLAKSMVAAVDAGLLARTPCRNVDLPRIERQEMRFLTPLEVRSLSEAINPRYRALVLLGAYGGLRIGEMAGLKVGRVNPLKGTVEVAETLVEVAGHLVCNQPKTRAGRRVVGLPSFVMTALKEHMAAFCDNAPDSLLFTAPQGGPLRVPAFRRRVWQRAVNESGLAPLRLHDLRHTAISLWIYAGANIKEVAVRAGHTSVAFTLDRYGHLYGDSDLMLRNKLDAMADDAENQTIPQVHRLGGGPGGVTLS